MQDIEFTDAEFQFIITSANEFVKQTGLANAALGLSVVGKLQAAAAQSAGVTPIDGGAAPAEESAAEGV